MAEAPLPKHLRIGGFDWAVKCPQRELTENANWGETHSKTFEIRIDDGAPRQRCQSTLLHEIIHASTNTLLLPKDQIPEKHVRIVALCLFQVFRDNPEVLQFLTASDEKAAL